MALVTAVVLIAYAARPATAHSFLVRTSPAGGQRVEASPGEVVLDFSEAVDASATVAVRPVGGLSVGVLFVGLDDGGRRARANLPALAQGAYEVAWRVRAVDGHETAGQFAFAVGRDVPAELVVGATSGAATSNWLFGLALGVALAGLLVTLGGLVSDVLIWRGRADGIPRSFAIPALLVANGGTMAALVVQLAQASDWRWPWAWAAGLAAARSRQLVVVWLLVVVAGLLARLKLFRPVVIAIVAVAAGVIVWSGHVGVGGRWWAAVGLAHVVFAGAWLGALAHLARVARVAPCDVTAAGARRYARGAFVSVVVVVAAGVVMSLRLLDSPSDMWRSGYGRVLAAKVSLVAVAVVLAVVGRRRGLPGAGARVAVLAAVTRWEALTLVGVVVVSGVLGSTAPPSVAERWVLAAAPLSNDAVWAADLAGSYLVLVGAAEGRLRLDVLAPGGLAPRDATFAVSLLEPADREVDLIARSCGPGCASIDHQWQSGVTTVVVTVSGGEYGAGIVRLPIAWPAGPDATALLAGALAVTRSVASLMITETVDSGAGAVSGPYTTMVSGELFIGQQPYAGGGDGVHRLADEDGLMTVSLVVRGSNTWAKLWISPDDLLVVRSLVVDPGHRVTHEVVSSP